MDMGLGFLGTYICAAEIEGKEPTLTISAVRLEKVESLKSGDDDASGKIKDKWVVYFSESKTGRGWLINRTNAECIKEMWGRDVSQWIGHAVTLHAQKVRVGKKMELGIRVKGSPELEADLVFDLVLPRKKPVRTVLVKTTRKEPRQNQSASALPA